MMFIESVTMSYSLKPMMTPWGRLTNKMLSSFMLIKEKSQFQPCK